MQLVLNGNVGSDWNFFRANEFLIYLDKNIQQKNWNNYISDKISLFRYLYTDTNMQLLGIILVKIPIVKV